MGTKQIPFLAAWVVALSLAGSVCASDFELEVGVEEPAGLARKSEPVCGGIPLPAGRFKEGQPLALFEGNTEVPVQVLPLVVDQKGSLRWVLLDFQTDVGAGEKKKFTLKAQRPTVVSASAVKVVAAEDEVRVDTGKVEFTVARDKPFSLFTSVEAGGRPVVIGGGASYTDGFDGKTYVAGKPTSVEVEYAGPLRTTVCVKGGFVGDENSKLLYIARITAWAGRSDVHVKYSLANSNPDHYCYRRVKDSTIRLRLAARPEAALLGTSKPLKASGESWLQQSSRVVPAAIHSHDSLANCPWLRETPGASQPGGCQAGVDGREVWSSQGKGDVAEGWIAATLGPCRAWACDLYFVEDPPRRLALSEDMLALTGVTMPVEGTKLPFAEKQRWLFDCSHLSSQYVLDFAAPAEAAELSAKAKRARARLWCLAPPSWYFETESLPVGKFGTQADELACYDRWNWKYDIADVPRATVGQIARIQRWVAGDDNHFTSEQDTLDSLVLMYLRTGSRAFFDASEAWANYFMDLQTWRTDGWRWKDGGVWWTSRGSPLGNRPQRSKDPVIGMWNRLPLGPVKPENMSVRIKDEIVNFKIPLDLPAIRYLHFLANAKACYCHNWGEGLAEWFCLTGDRDAFEAAIDTVEQNIDTQRRAFGKAPGMPSSFSRDFTRACYLTNATRLIAPTDPFVVDASDYLASVYLERPNKEPRGLVNAAKPVQNLNLKNYVGDQGIAEMQELGVTMDPGRVSSRTRRPAPGGSRWSRRTPGCSRLCLGPWRPTTASPGAKTRWTG